MRYIGFSTGAITKGDFEFALSILEDSLHATAVELSVLRTTEFTPLWEKIDTLDLSKYSYKSIHAPSDFEHEDSLIAGLSKFAAKGMNIVVHPDRIKKIDSWRILGDKLCIENMDARKSTGKTIEELRPFFAELPLAKLCFDIGHARQVDASMTEARKLLEELTPRLAQIHFSEVNKYGHHQSSVSTEALRDFCKVASLIPKATPVIIESTINESKEKITGIELDGVISMAFSKEAYSKCFF